MSSAILLNSPALHSLKRHQLIKLAKRHGIKASGKNAEIVARLREHGNSLPSDVLNAIPSDSASTFPASDSILETGEEQSEEEDRNILAPRVSEQWEAIEEDSREEQLEMIPGGFPFFKSTWASKSTVTLAPAAEFGVEGPSSSNSNLSVGSSLKAFATSIKRAGSKMSSLSSVAKSKTDLIDVSHSSFPCSFVPEEFPCPAAPDDPEMDAFPNTIRLVTSTSRLPDLSPPRLRPFSPSPDDLDGSLQPITQFRDEGVESIYPTIPTGHFSDNPPSYNTRTVTPPHSPPPFIFGSPDHALSNSQFNSAAEAVMAEMNKRLAAQGAPTFDRTRTAPLPSLTSTTSIFDSPKKRFDGIHDKQFAKMDSIVSHYAAKRAPPVNTSKKRKSVLDDERQGAKRPRMSEIHAQNARIQIVEPNKSKKEKGREGDNLGKEKVGSVKEPRPDCSSEEENVVVVKDREAIKRKLEISRDRRRSSKGRVSISGGRGRISAVNTAQKGPASKFGFLKSVRNVWNRTVSGNKAAPNTTSSIPIPTAVSSNIPTLKTSTTSKATKSQPDPAPPPVPKKDLNLFTKLSSKPGLTSRGSRLNPNSSDNTGRKASETKQASASDLRKVSGGMTGLSRRKIPSFGVDSIPLYRKASNASGSGSGTTSSKASSTLVGSGRSRDGDPATKMIKSPSSILPGRKPSIQFSGQPDPSVRKRTMSTLFAPTASSLAKMNRLPPTLQRSQENRSLSSVEESVVKTSALATKPAPSISFALTSVTNTTGAPPPVRIETKPLPGFGVLPPDTHSEEPAKPSALKPKPPSTRRPRISRSRVIAKLSAKREEAANLAAPSIAEPTRKSLGAIAHARSRKSMGIKAAGIGSPTPAGMALAAKRRARQSEVARRKSRVTLFDGEAPIMMDET